MDYSRGVQALKETTDEVVSGWAELYHKLIESKYFILFVFCVSNILYIIVSIIHKIFSYRRNQ